MKTGLLFNHDGIVASWVFGKYNQPNYKIDCAIGLIKVDCATLAGAALLHNWNGSNIELSYYGEGTLTAGIFRSIMRHIVCTYSPSRLTIVTSKRNKHLTSKRNKHFMRVFQRIGFKYEGSQRCYYGHRDCIRNTGVRFVMFRQRMNQIARIDKHANGLAPGLLTGSSL